MKRKTGLNHAALTEAFSADVKHVEYHLKLKRCGIQRRFVSHQTD
jgi:hypothetical protein